MSLEIEPVKDHELNIEDGNDSEDDRNSDFSIIDEDRDELIEQVEKSEATTYKDPSLTISECRLSEVSQELNDISIDQLPLHPQPFYLPQSLTLSNFVDEKSTDEAVERLLVEYKVNHGVLDEVRQAVMDIKQIKANEQNEQVVQFSKELDELKKKLKEKDDRISTLETIMSTKLENSTTTLQSLFENMDKINSLAESINSFSKASTVDQQSVTSDIEHVELPVETTDANPYQEVQAQLSEMSLNSSTSTCTGIDYREEYEAAVGRLEQAEILSTQLRTALDQKAEEITELKQLLSKKEHEMANQEAVIQMLHQDTASFQESFTNVVSDHENQIKSLESELQRLHERNEIPHKHRRRVHQQKSAHKPTCHRHPSNRHQHTHSFTTKPNVNVDHIVENVNHVCRNVNRTINNITANLTRRPAPQMYICDCLRAFSSNGQYQAHKASCNINLD